MELMRRSVRLFCVALMTAVVSVSPVMAIMETQSTAFTPLSPLIITSYRTTITGTGLDFVEVYNSGDMPINVTDWAIIDATNGRTMGVHSRDGLLEPAHHAVMASTSSVANASYEFDTWQTNIPSPKPIATLELTRAGYRPSDITIASKNLGVWMMRTYNTSSYSTSTFEASYRSLWDDGLYVPPAEPQGLEVSEVYAYASDCELFDEDARCSDYVELHNISLQPIDLSDIVLRTDSNSSSRATSNTFTLDTLLAPDAYLLVSHTDDGGAISLTNSGGHIWLEDMWGVEQPFHQLVAEWPSVSSDYQGFGYARDETGAWKWTSTPTPGAANHIVPPVIVPAECPAGKYRNPDTGRCRTIEEAVSELATCEEGYERNPTTNRCRKVASSAVASSLTPCGEGQERNPVTNRCRSIASAVAELMPCDEGYERNPATNRCRKVQSTSVPSAPFAVESVAADAPVWQWWMGGAIAAGLVSYAVWEWRHEISKLWTRISKK